MSSWDAKDDWREEALMNPEAEAALYQAIRNFMAAPNWAQWVMGFAFLILPAIAFFVAVLDSPPDYRDEPARARARARRLSCEHEYIIEAQEKEPGEFYAYRICHKCMDFDMLGSVEFTLLEENGMGLDYEPVRRKKLFISREMNITGQEPRIGGKAT
jgi:hypothetical protein